MKTTVEELKAYYVKIGGNAADVVGIDTIPDMIAKITAISGGGGGGSDLPEVTSEDNGDVLTVVEGAWAKAESVAGTEFIVQCEKDGVAGFTTDKTFDEIEVASKNGQRIVFSVVAASGEGHLISMVRDEYEYEGETVILYIGSDVVVGRNGSNIIITQIEMNMAKVGEALENGISETKFSAQASSDNAEQN